VHPRLLSLRASDLGAYVTRDTAARDGSIFEPKVERGRMPYSTVTSSGPTR
jgi:hypothetical protein